MPSLFSLIFYVAAFLGLAFASPVYADGPLRGRWRLLEFACVNPQGQRQILAPGLPGSHEEWTLRFHDAGLTGSFSYAAIYVGLMNESCSLRYNGSFSGESPPQNRRRPVEVPLTALRLTPQRTSLQENGMFPVPCQLFNTQRSQRLEARFERLSSGGAHLYLRGSDGLKRCPGPRDSTEFLFELF